MATLRRKFDDAAGRVCKAVLPIRHELYEGAAGNDGRVAICTLGSIGLLAQISQRPEIMSRVALAGRLLSENKGIDAIVQYALAHPRLERIVLCGREVKGHMAGQALLSLYRNGTDGSSGRIIGAKGPYPVLASTAQQVARFRSQIREITDAVGETDIEKIARLL
ncbi:MAG: tetrahydromethanopterin S-methyltransferase subunit A [Thermoproteota archaeon]